MLHEVDVRGIPTAADAREGDYAYNYSVEAEMSCLGAMMLREYAVNEVKAILHPHHFYSRVHRTIFEAMLTIPDGGDGIDFVQLCEALGPDRLRAIGGPDYILKIVEYTPSAAGAKEYAKIVLGKYTRRYLTDQARELIRAANDHSKGIDELTAAASALAELPGAARPAAFIDLSEVELGDSGDTGIPTGYKSLDGAISTGGYPKGQMSVIRAYHKGGKTMFMTGSSVAASIAGLRVCYATFADLNARQLKRRIMRNLTGWGQRPTKDLMLAEDFDSYLGDIKYAWEYFVYDASALDSGDDIETFCAWLKAEHAKKPFDIVYVDYAQELRSNDRKAGNEVSEQNVCAHKLNRLAAQTGLPIVVGSQITEGAEGQKAKTKYSRAWEEKAGWVLTLQREESTVWVEISYSRFGPQGERFAMRMNENNLRIEDQG